MASGGGKKKNAVLASQVVVMGAIEAYRVNGGPFGGRDLNLVNPSGKQFDPLGLADDPDTAAELKVKETQKGPLAMLSLFGYYVQAAVAGQGPVGHWASHIADPFAVNGLTLEIAGQYTPSVAMFTDAGKHKEPQVDLSDCCGPQRKRWLGPNAADSYVPDYLTGEYPGLVTTVGAALGLLQAPRPSSQQVGSIAIFNLVLCPCLLLCFSVAAVLHP